MFKRSPSVPKKCPYKKTVQCLAVVPVALSIAVCRLFALLLMCWWVRTPENMEPSASLAMRISTLSKLIAWPTRHNASFVASIALTRSRRVFLVLVRLSMCEGKRTPWSHTCVSASSTKCMTCKCLIRSPAPLKLNIPGLGHQLRRGRQPTTTTPSEHASSQSSSIVRLLFWTRRRLNFIAFC